MSIDGNSVLAIVPARKNSKRIPNKNLKKLNGKPLIDWTIESAIRSLYIDTLVLSSDSPEILTRICENEFFKRSFRPNHLAEDDTPMIKVVQYEISQYPDFDIVLVLQPTSPMRSSNDIDKVLELVSKCKSPVVSVCESQENPFWTFTSIEDNELISLFPDALYKRSQDLPKTFFLNGALYSDFVNNILLHGTFVRHGTKGYIMESFRSIDIDTLEDFMEVEKRFST